MSLTLKICGAAHTVTGSCHLFENDGTRFLVDCGMFQGQKTLKELNYGDFPFDPRSIDFVLLTHAHIDHSGLLPKLVKAGFKGPIYATRGTIGLCSYMLPDSGYIHEMEVRTLNRRNAHRNRDAVEPIYTAADATAALDSFKAVEYETWVEPAKGIRVRYWNAGHILGSASIEIEVHQDKTKPVRILASGDIGPNAKLLQPDPDGPNKLDIVLCESTYGGTVRPQLSELQRRQHFAEEVRAAAKRKGALVIPAFAVERTQELLADLIGLMESGEVPTAPIFLDSPLAIHATEVFLAHDKDLETQNGFKKAIASPHLRFTETVEESKAIARFKGFHIIIAASGMCDAGRIRHHLRQWLWNDAGTVLLVGFQAVGTLGRLLEEGAETVRIQGEEIRVRAQIRKMDDYSGHADSNELISWLTARKPIIRGLFLVHGEETAMNTLAQRIGDSIMDAKAVFKPLIDTTYDLSGPVPVMVAQQTAPRLEAEAVTKLDWHNDLSKLLIDINARLDKAADKKGRAVILRRMRQALEENT